MVNNGRTAPTRTCVACGTKKPKDELTRFVIDGDVCEDERQIRQGRGAYVCKNDKCRDTGIKKNKLQRSLQNFNRRNRKTG